MSSVKQKRLEGIIRKNISDIVMFYLKDPNVGFVTITDVSVSNDHSYATVYCSFLGQDPRNEAGLKALNRAKGYIRTELSKRLDIRRTPELNFVLDKSIAYGKHIDEVISEIHANEAKKEEDE